MATTPGPNGLCTMARRQACRCDCGISCVSREQQQRVLRMRGSPAHAGPSTTAPIASMAFGGSPAMT
eukprot:11222292-Lingulodinium_polyedra.AAC.1